MDVHDPGGALRSPYPVEPWQVREPRLELDRLAQTESIFALSNGHIGLRANLDEGEPHELPGTYLNSFYEMRPLPYAEAGYGYPESGQTIVNVTNGKVIRLLVDDHPLDVRYGQVLRHERVLDLRAGTLSRELEWVSPSGSAVRVRSRRLVSFTQHAIAAIRYEVEAIGEPVRLIVQSELLADEPVPTPSKDPRAAAALKAPLLSEAHHATADRRGADPPHQGQRAADGRGDGARRRRAGRDPGQRRGAPRRRPHHGGQRTCAPASGCA